MGEKAEGAAMNDQQIKERCKRLINSIYGPRADGNVGAAYDEYVQEAESLYREAMAAGRLRMINEIGDLWDNGDPTNHEFVAWCRQEAARVKEGGG